MKNKMKKLVAFLCVLTMSLGAMTAWSPVKEVKATATSTDSAPIYLKGFNHITLENFGLSEGNTYNETTYVQLKDNKGAAVTGTFDKTLLSLKVQFTPGGSNRCSPLMIGGDGWYTGFAFSPNNAGTAVGIMEWFRDTPDFRPMTVEENVVNEQVGVLYASDVSADFNFKNEFTLQISFEYTTENNQTYLTLTFYVNGKHVQINERLTSNSNVPRVDSLKMKISDEKTNHGNYIGFDTSGLGGTLKMSSVFVPTEESNGPVPVYLPGFKHITLENFNIPKEITYSTEDKFVQLKDNKGAAVTGTFDKTLLSLEVDFTYDSNDRAAFMFGGSGWNTGFAFSPNNSGSAVGIINYFNANNPMNDDVQQYQPGVIQAAKVNEALGRDDFSFLEAFTLQVSFEYTTEGTETYLILTFYVNGKQIEVDNRAGGTSGNFQPYLKMKVTNSMENHGNYIGYRKGDGGTLKLSSVVAENDKLTSITWSDFGATKVAGAPVYLEGFKHVTLENFNIPKEITYSTEDKFVQLKDNNGIPVEGTFDKTLLSLEVDFTYNSNDRAAFMFGGSGWNTGFAFSPNNSGSAVGIINYFNENIPMNDDVEKYQPGVIQVTKVNEALGRDDFSFLEPFTLQISFEYITEDADTYLILTFYVNGEQIEIDDRTSGASGNFRPFLKMKVTNSIENHGNYIGYRKGNGGTLFMRSIVPEDVSNYTFVNKAFLKSGQTAYVLKENYEIAQLTNTSFEGKVTFLSNSDNDVIYYGGDGVSSGLRFSAGGENGEQLKLHFGDDELYLDANTADIDFFVDNEFGLKITTEYANYDGQGDSNDVQLGIFINGKLYNNSYLYVYDYINAGNYVTIDSNEKGVMLRTVTSGRKEVTYDLSQGPYSVVTDFGAVTKVMKGNTEMTFDGDLTVAGDYTLYNGNIFVGEVVLYQEGDVHADSKSDVKDLIAMKKVNANIALDTWAGTMGAYKAEFSEVHIIDRLLDITEQ